AFLYHYFLLYSYFIILSPLPLSVQANLFYFNLPPSSLSIRFIFNHFSSTLHFISSNFFYFLSFFPLLISLFFSFLFFFSLFFLFFFLLFNFSLYFILFFNFYLF